MMAPLVKAPN